MRALLSRIEHTIEQVVLPIVDNDVFNNFRCNENLYFSTIELSAQDALSYEQRDPASHGNINLIIDTYQTYHAVMCYRIAHGLLLECSDDSHKKTAHRLSFAARLRTGIDIHPAAKIGAGFVIDHGWGTVIGETAIIGRDCYFLECVTLGARGISNNSSGKRHPTIGNRVEIGGHAKILGDISIGDDSFIAPNTIITDDIPPQSKVLITNQIQISDNTSDNFEKLIIFGIVLIDDEIVIQTNGVRNPIISIVNNDNTTIYTLDAIITNNKRSVISCKISDKFLCFNHLNINLLIDDCGRRSLVKNVQRIFTPIDGSTTIIPNTTVCMSDANVNELLKKSIDDPIQPIIQALQF